MPSHYHVLWPDTLVFEWKYNHTSDSLDNSDWKWFLFPHLTIWCFVYVTYLTHYRYAIDLYIVTRRNTGSLICVYFFVGCLPTFCQHSSALAETMSVPMLTPSSSNASSPMTTSIRLAAISWSPGTTWLYKSMVTLILLCPSRSWTTLPISTKGPFSYLPWPILTFYDAFLHSGIGYVHFVPLHQLQLGWHIFEE